MYIATYTYCIIGQYEIQINKFEHSPPEWQIRPVHPEYVTELKKVLRANTGHEHLTEPVVGLVDADPKEVTGTKSVFNKHVSLSVSLDFCDVVTYNTFALC